MFKLKIIAFIFTFTVILFSNSFSVVNLTNTEEFKSITDEKLSEKLSCLICLQEIINKDLISLNCYKSIVHNYHQKCLKKWLKVLINRNQPLICPYCKNPIDLYLIKKVLGGDFYQEDKFVYFILLAGFIFYLINNS